jgi:hypothetical protein
MVTATQVGIRFTEDDFALIQAIMIRTGIMNRTDVVRLAIRRLAAAEGIELPQGRLEPGRPVSPATKARYSGVSSGSFGSGRVQAKKSRPQK